MKGKCYTTEDKIRILREADGGKAINEVCRAHNISEVSFHRWKRQFGMMEINEARRLTGSGEHGIATIHDQDLLIFVISQWIDAKRVGLEPTRRISFTPYQFFTWMGKAPQGTAYARLREALYRLKTTNIETTIRLRNTGRNRVKQFSWISEWEIHEEDGKIRGIEVVLAEWLFESIQGFHVLTLDKRYFDIAGPVERWLYLYACEVTG